MLPLSYLPNPVLISLLHVVHPLNYLTAIPNPFSLLPSTNVLEEVVSHIESPKRKANWSCSVAAKSKLSAPAAIPTCERARVTATRVPATQVTEQVHSGTPVTVPARCTSRVSVPGRSQVRSTVQPRASTSATAPTLPTTTIPSSRGRKRVHSPEVVDSRRATTVDFSNQRTDALRSGESVSLTSPHPSRPSKAIRRSTSPRPSHSTAAVAFHPSATPDSVELELDETNERYTFDGEEVDLLADPASWRPFPRSSQLLVKDGQTLGFRTRSGAVFGPEKVEIRPDVSGQQWLFRFITHDYSTPVDLPSTRRTQQIRRRHDLDVYLWSLDESLRSRCSEDSTFKKLPYTRFAMEVTVPHECLLLKDEFADREKLWISFYETKKVDWRPTPAFLLKLRNEGLENLHTVLQAPALKTDVAKLQLRHDVGLLTAEIIKKDTDARNELSYLIGLFAHTAVLAADHKESIKFITDEEAASQMNQISLGLSALPDCFDVLLKAALVRFFEARLEMRQMVFKGYEQNVRVLELQRSSPFCEFLFPEDVVKDALDAMKTSPLGMSAFFKKKRFFSLSSNMPFKSNARAQTTSKTFKSSAKKPVVYHPVWSKSSQPRSGKKTEYGNKTPAKSKPPFRGRKGGPYKGRGRGGTK